MLPKAILFDLDDTIVTEEKAGDIAWEEVCEIISLETGLFDSKLLNTEINRIRKEFWENPQKRALGARNIKNARMRIVREALASIECNNEQLAETIVNSYTRLKMEKTSFVPHAEDTLKHLQSCGVKMAVLTNGDGLEQRPRIDRFGISKLVHTCLIEGELGFGKPDPRIYQLALTRLGVNTSETWMVGDRLEIDIAGAQQLGIFTVWCDYGKKGLPADSKIKPHKIITEIKQLLT